MKCGDCINYVTCRHTCNVVRISDICSSFLGKLSCDGCKYDSDRFSDICYHDCIMFSDYEKEHFSIPKEKPMENKVIFESREEFVRVLTDCGIIMDTHCQDRAVEKGYICKSPVEEAEEMLYDWKAGHTTDINDMVVKSIEAIQHLKEENERLRK